MRQREDLEFTLALNNMSEGKMTNADKQLINKREVQIGDIPFDAIRLFYSNDKANSYNAFKLAQTDTEEFTSMAKDTVKATSIPVRDRV